MKYFLFIVIAFNSYAISIKDYSPYKYEVYFTNPVCEEYAYENPVLTNNGNFVLSKPKNVYCKDQDTLINEFRITSPNYHVLKLIEDKDVNELFLAYLSFSNHQVADALCRAIRRDVKVTFIIDSNAVERNSARREIDFIKSCRPITIENEPRVEFRGNISGLGYAHNKIIMASYKSNPQKAVVVFGSGNMSTGTTTHHENWNFLTTNKKTHFYQSHGCIKEGMLDVQSRSRFKKFMKECRSKISVPQEDDIKVYAIPTDGKVTMDNIKDKFSKATSIDGAAHRFTHPAISDAIVKAENNGKRVRFILDDDIYWVGVRGKTTGASRYMEFVNSIKIIKAGAEVRYMQTNQNNWQLHHNKFLIFNFADGTGGVHTGAGNFTKAAFSKNFENYYYMTMPEAVDQFRTQFDHMFNNLGTSFEMMPAIYVNP